MADIRIDLKNGLLNGQSVVFEAPCNCTEVTGLVAYYHDGTAIKSKNFSFKDAHGENVAGLGNLFGQGSYVKAVLDTTKGFAYIQNADTNSYIEGRFDELNSEIEDTGWNTEDENAVLRYRRKNGIVYVIFHYFNNNSPVTDGQEIGYLPEGYRPKYLVIVSSYNSYMAVKIEASGRVSIVSQSSQVASHGYVHADISYPFD